MTIDSISSIAYKLAHIMFNIWLAEHHRYDLLNTCKLHTGFLVPVYIVTTDAPSLVAQASRLFTPLPYVILFLVVSGVLIPTDPA